jgi:ankyrin repeat protein
LRAGFATVNHRDAVSFVNQCGKAQGADDEYPLHLAVRAEQTKLVGALLEAGADASLKSIRNGEYTRGNFDKIDPTTGEKQAVSPEYRTPLFICAENGNVAITKLLLHHGSDVNTADGDGCTALYVALDEDQVGIAEALLAAGAATDTGNTDIGLDNHLLAWAASRRQLEHVQLLLKYKADPNQPGKSGMYPLHMAARGGGRTVLEALLASGADPTKTCPTHRHCPGVTAREVVEKNPRAVAAGCLEVLW